MRLTGVGIFWIWLLALLASGAAPASAAPAGVGVPLSVCVARAAPGDSARRMWDAPGRYDCRSAQTDLGAGDFWVVARAIPAASGAGMRAARLRSLSLWQRIAIIRLRYADGEVVTIALNDHAAAQALRLGATFEVKVPRRNVPLTGVLWHVRGSTNVRGVVASPQLATPAESHRSELALGALYAAFAGMTLALLIHNAALWAALRHRFHLPYCAMAAALLGYAASSSGALVRFMPMLSNTDRIRLNYMFLAAAGIAALRFARSFFDPAVFAGWPRRALDASTLAVTTATIAFVALAPWQARALDALYALSFMSLLALALVVLVRACRGRANLLWLFAVAWALPIAFAALRVAGRFRFVSHDFLIENASLIAMAAETLLSAVAIAYRLRLLMRERDEARASEVRALHLADTDPLTGLINRRAFLREAIGAPGERLLLLVDVDHFKRVNETLGHEGGDEVLRRIARALRSVIPPGGLVARIGGEEFALIAPEADDGLAQRVLASIRSMRMPFDITVTASLGSGIGPLESEADWSRLYRSADAALFAAKAEGRDRARHADLLAA